MHRRKGALTFMNMNQQLFGGSQQQMYTPHAFNLISREELKRLAWDEGKSDAEIASLYHVTTNQVNHKRRQMNLIQGEVSAEQLSEIVRLAETVKTLPMEAIQEIKTIVDRYTNSLES